MNHINSKSSHTKSGVGKGKIQTMGNIKCRSYATLLPLLLCLFDSTALGKVRVVVMNRLGEGRVMNIHCQSQDNDLGDIAVLDGQQISWKFFVNFWGTTLFYCDVQWGNAEWQRFDAYSYERDGVRCKTQCVWKILEDGSLYTYDDRSREWSWMPFKD